MLASYFMDDSTSLGGAGHEGGDSTSLGAGLPSVFGLCG